LTSTSAPGGSLTQKRLKTNNHLEFNTKGGKSTDGEFMKAKGKKEKGNMNRPPHEYAGGRGNKPDLPKVKQKSFHGGQDILVIRKIRRSAKGECFVQFATVGNKQVS